MGDKDHPQGQLDSMKVSEIETGFEDPTKAQLTSTDQETAEELNLYFKSVFTHHHIDLVDLH